MEDDWSPEMALAQSLRPGSWTWDVREDIVVGDARLAEIFGLDPRLVHNGVKLETIVNVVHEEDRADLYMSIARSIEFCHDYDATYRVKTPSEEKWVRAMGRCYQTRLSKHHVGVLLDITGLKSTRAYSPSLRLDHIAQHCLSANRLAHGPDFQSIRESIALTLRKIGHELARAAQHN